METICCFEKIVEESMNGSFNCFLPRKESFESDLLA